MTPTTIHLPPLTEFSRADLVELVRILHAALVAAHRDYQELHVTAKHGLDSAKAALVEAHR